jgi:hypothetical protein
MRRPPRRRSPLRAELADLKAKVRREDIRLGEIERQFWLDGGVCCPSCGVPGYSEAMSAQERRELRIQYLENKLRQPSEKAMVSIRRSLIQVIADLIKGTP